MYGFQQEESERMNQGDDEYAHLLQEQTAIGLNDGVRPPMRTGYMERLIETAPINFFNQRPPRVAGPQAVPFIGATEGAGTGNGRQCMRLNSKTIVYVVVGIIFLITTGGLAVSMGRRRYRR